MARSDFLFFVHLINTLTSVTCITCQMWIFLAVTNLHLSELKIVDDMRILRYIPCVVCRNCSTGLTV